MDEKKRDKDVLSVMTIVLSSNGLSMWGGSDEASVDIEMLTVALYGIFQNVLNMKPEDIRMKMHSAVDGAVDMLEEKKRRKGN